MLGGVVRLTACPLGYPAARQKILSFPMGCRGVHKIETGRATLANDRWSPDRLWCNWQHPGLWYPYSRFEPWQPSYPPVRFM